MSPCRAVANPADDSFEDALLQGATRPPEATQQLQVRTYHSPSNLIDSIIYALRLDVCPECSTIIWITSAALTLQIEFGDEGSRDRVQQAWAKYEESKQDDWAMPKVEVSIHLVASHT